MADFFIAFQPGSSHFKLNGSHNFECADCCEVLGFCTSEHKCDRSEGLLLRWRGIHRRIRDEPRIRFNKKLSPMILRPDFESDHSDTFLIAFRLFHLYDYGQAYRIAKEFLRRPVTPSAAAASSFRILKQLLKWRELSLGRSGASTHSLLSYRVKTPLLTKSDCESLHIEQLIAITIKYVRRWSHPPESEKFIERKELQEFLLYALKEIQSWVPMPPVEGAEMTDMKVLLCRIFQLVADRRQIIGRILLHHVLTSPMVPMEDLDWASLVSQEWQNFQILCQYLLDNERVDLLILAVDFRVSKQADEVTYSRNIMRKASQIPSLSIYQEIKCQLRCGGPALVILRFEWLTGAFKLRQFYKLTSNKRSRLGLFKGSKNLLHDDEFDVEAYGNIPDAVYFYDIRSMKPIFWREEAAFLLSGRVQTVGLSDNPEFETCYNNLSCSRCQRSPRNASLDTEFFSTIAKIKYYDITTRCYLIHLLYWLRDLEPTSAFFESEIEPSVHPKNILFLKCIEPGLLNPQIIPQLPYGNFRVLAWLYLEQFLWTAPLHVRTQHPQLIKAMLKAYEKWFKHYCTQKYYTLKDGFLARKLILVAALNLYHIGYGPEVRKSISRCIYYLLGYIEALNVSTEQSSETKAAEAADCAMTIAVRWLQGVPDKGRGFDRFEVAALGWIAASHLKQRTSLQAQEYLNLGSLVEAFLVKRGSLGCNNETEFPDLFKEFSAGRHPPFPLRPPMIIDYVLMSDRRDSIWANSWRKNNLIMTLPRITPDLLSLPKYEKSWISTSKWSLKHKDKLDEQLFYRGRSYHYTLLDLDVGGYLGRDMIENIEHFDALICYLRGKKLDLSMEWMKDINFDPR